MRQFSLVLVFLWMAVGGAAQDALMDAAKQLQAAIERFEADTLETAAEAMRVAQLYAAQDFPERAIEYGRIARVRLANGDTLRTAVDTHLARMFERAGELDSALYYRYRLLQERRHDHRAQLAELQHIAHLQEAEGDLIAALETYEDVLALSRGTERATALNNVGYLRVKLDELLPALDAFEAAERADSLGTVLDRTKLLLNLGVTHYNLRNYPQALRYFDRAAALESTDRALLARVNHFRALAHLERSDFYNAQLANTEAAKQARSAPDAALLSQTYRTAADIYQQLYEYEEAFDYYQRHLRIRDSLLLDARAAQQRLADSQVVLERTERDLRLQLVNNRLSKIAIAGLELERNNLALAQEKLELEAQRRAAELELLQKESSLRDAALANQRLAAQQAQQQLELTQRQLALARRDREVMDLQQRDREQAAEIARRAAAEEDRLREIEALERDRELDAMKIQQQESFRRSAILIGGLGVLLTLGLALGGLFARRANRRLQSQKAEIEAKNALVEQEKEKSDRLLLNILPAATAAELRERGSATPRAYASASILFTDFVNFSSYAEQLAPEALIGELNACFIAFDQIVGRHGLEKIKTIGDAYMAAAGIPTEQPDHALRAVRAALDMQTFMEKRYARSLAEGQPFCRMRVGIHSGPLVAGVVGERKFAYDIWGDAVNLAARMEQNGAPGRVNVSATTHALVRDAFPGDFRGEIAVKNKGAVGMYFVG